MKTQEEKALGDVLSKAYVSLISSGCWLRQARRSNCLSCDEEDILDDAAKLVEVVSNMILYLVEEKELLVGMEL